MYNSVTARVSTTLNGQTCYKTSMTLDTTGITYGNGVYDVWVSTLFDTTGTFDGHKCFDYTQATNSGQWASITTQYSTTTPFAYTGTLY